MTEEEKAEVCKCIDNEGFEYCFDGYSDFSEIKDTEFHRLRKAYLKAAEDLAKYVGLEQF